MAVATPILEKRIEETQEKSVYGYSSIEIADKIHNSRISERFKQIMNADNTMSDLKSSVAQPVQSAPVALESYQAAAPVQNEIYQVEGARTSADLFRADSAINRKVSFAQTEDQPIMVAQQIVEEENEDLVPTRTTMQYISANQKADEEGAIANSAKKRINLSKRDKIIIGAVIAVIVALFTLIIVNAAIISGASRDLGNLQSSLNEARESYESVNQDIADFESNFDEWLAKGAEANDMVK